MSRIKPLFVNTLAHYIYIYIYVDVQRAFRNITAEYIIRNRVFNFSLTPFAHFIFNYPNRIPCPQMVLLLSVLSASREHMLSYITMHQWPIVVLHSTLVRCLFLPLYSVCAQYSNLTTITLTQNVLSHFGVGSS